MRVNTNFNPKIKAPAQGREPNLTISSVASRSEEYSGEIRVLIDYCSAFALNASHWPETQSRCRRGNLQIAAQKWPRVYCHRYCWALIDRIGEPTKGSGTRETFSSPFGSRRDIAPDAVRPRLTEINVINGLQMKHSRTGGQHRDDCHEQPGSKGILLICFPRGGKLNSRFLDRVSCPPRGQQS